MFGKECQVSSAKAPSVPYKKVTLSNFIRKYTVSIWKTSNRICQNCYQKIPLCKIHALALKFTIVMYPQRKTIYLSSILLESPRWNLSCITKILLFLSKEQREAMYSSTSTSRQLVALDQTFPDGLCAVASTIVLAENRVYQLVETAWRQFKPSSTLIVKNWMKMFLQSKISKGK